MSFQISCKRINQKCILIWIHWILAWINPNEQSHWGMCYSHCFGRGYWIAFAQQDTPRCLGFWCCFLIYVCSFSLPWPYGHSLKHILWHCMHKACEWNERFSKNTWFEQNNIFQIIKWRWLIHNVFINPFFQCNASGFQYFIEPFCICLIVGFIVLH